MADKMNATHHEREKTTSEIENGSDGDLHSKDQQLNRIDTVDVDNYHGLTTQTIIVYLALNLISFCQLYNVVGAGLLARDVASAVGGTTESQWMAQGIVILTALLGPPVSQAADYWGRKWFIVVLTAFGFVGSIITARANSMGQAIAGEVINGVSYGAQPLLFAVGSEILPRRVRPAAQAGLNISGALGAITGLLVGSALTKTNIFGFRTFWEISCAIFGASTIICALLYNPPSRPLQKQLTTGQKLAKLDWVAYALLAPGITLFVMGLSWGDNPYKWSDAHTLAPLIVGAAILVGLIVHQTFIKKDGLVNHRLFSRDRNFAICFLAFFIDGIVFWAANNYFAFEIGILYETDSVRSGLRYAITFITAVPFSFFIAYFSSKTKMIREPLVLAFLLFTLFFGLMAGATLGSSSAVWAYPIFLGIGLGWSLTLLVTAAQLSAPPDLIAIVSGLLLAVRSLGGSVGIGIYTAIFSSKLSAHLGSDIAAAVLPLGLSPRYLPDFIGALAGNEQAALAHIPGVTPQIIGAGVGALKHAYLESFRYIWVTAAVFSFVTAIACLFIINPKKDMTQHVDAPLEKED